MKKKQRRGRFPGAMDETINRAQKGILTQMSEDRTGAGRAKQAGSGKKIAG
jgi:hypothetical protein